MLLVRQLSRLIGAGAVTLIDADGDVHRIEGTAEGPDVTVRLHDRGLHWRLLLEPRLAYGEAWVDGTLTIDGGRLYDFLELLGRNMAAFEATPVARAGFALDRLSRRIRQFNPIHRSRRNVAHHYDLSGALYELFLDRDSQYSCAYFQSPDASLDDAQMAKKRHVAVKLLPRPGQRVLDIGSGWGGMALHLAREYGVDVTGITLSTEQHGVASLRAADAGLADHVRFALRDYRHETGVYDRIVSAGMFEHVGATHYDAFFRKVRGLLADDGVMLLHAIGRMEPPGDTNPWIRKYIFPGGYTPALSEVLAAIERQGLWVTDVEILRLHYAETLRHWRRRFDVNRDRVKALAGFDERFCRMWEFYLASCEMSFRHMGQMVFQLQLAKRIDAVPVTRDYMVDEERRNRPRMRVAAE